VNELVLKSPWSIWNGLNGCWTSEICQMGDGEGEGEGASESIGRQKDGVSEL
jgi:hypothetical protein